MTFPAILDQRFDLFETISAFISVPNQAGFDYSKPSVASSYSGVTQIPTFEGNFSTTQV
jgi:hypothetical protein